MNDLKSQYRVLTVGFEADVLAELRSVFDVRCAISDDPTAEVNWNQLYLLNLDVEAPSMSAEMMACLDFVKQHFIRFQDINSRRHYYVTPPASNTYNAFVLSFYACYNIIKKYDVNLVLCSNIPHEGFDFILYQIARFLGLKTVMAYESLFPSRFWLTTKLEDFGLPALNPALFEKEVSNYKLPETWFYMAKTRRDASYSWTMLLQEVARRPWRLPPALVRFFYAQQYRKDVEKATQSLPQGETYIYFPLHLQPELSTSALGGDYSDQLHAVEALSAWVPEGVKIYVKENPKQTEKQRDTFFFKRLSALKNVRMLSNSENTINLIKGSVAVATITGTAGWEALFHGKPVISFGLAWYRWAPGVIEFKPDLAYETAVKAPLLSPAELSVALDEVMTTAGRGIVDLHYQAMIENFDLKENAVSVSNSFASYVAAKFGSEAAAL